MLFEAVDRATVRDQGSRELLENLGVNTRSIPVEIDPALRATPSPIPVEVRAQLDQLERPLIGVSLRYWQMDTQVEDWPSQVSLALDRVLDKLGGTIIFTPFHESDYFLENDLAVCIKVQKGMHHAERTDMFLALNPLERFSAMGDFDLMLGMRLHSLVSSIRAGVPSVGLSYDPKVRAFLDDLGLSEYIIELSKLDGIKLADRMLMTADNPKAFNRLKEKLARAIQSPSKSATAAKDLLENEAPKPALSPHLVNYALNQTLNLAKVEDEMARLSTVFRQAWGPDGSTDNNIDWVTDQLATTVQNQETLEKELTTHRERLKSSQIAIESLEKILHKVELDLRGEIKQRSASEEALDQARGFRILKGFWWIVWRFRDPRQTLREIRTGLKRLRRWLAERLRPITSRIMTPLVRFLPDRWRHLRFVLRAHHLKLEDNSSVVLYSDHADHFPGYQPRVKISGNTRAPVQVSLVATVRNEASNAAVWLRRLEKQTRQPDEVILLEGGSFDNTFEILERFAEKTTLNLKLVSKPNTNIATRRNFGVSMAQFPIIAMTDFGCTVDEDWLEKILIPFEINPDTEVVAGWYRAESSTRLGEWAKHELIPKISDINPQGFLPACRSIAFKKSAWEAVGGFADWLTKTGEDTFFDIHLKKTATRWAFVPDAQVVWHAPTTWKGIWDKLSSWTVGDGESGAFVGQYWSQTVATYRNAILTILGFGLAIGGFWISPLLGQVSLLIWAALVILGLAVDGFERGGYPGGITGGVLRRVGRAARVQGFLRGMKNRPEVILRRYAEAKGVVLFLSGVPIDDTGGGARGTQIALELLQRNNLVVFVHKYPKQESTDLELDFSHKHLLHFAADDFDWNALRWEFQKLLQEKHLTCILEFPFKEYLPIAHSVSKMGGKVVYDLIDEWNTSLGGDWYSEEVEQSVMERSDVLVGSAPSLVDRLEKASGRDAQWMPNAVNLRLFDRHKIHLPPDDLPGGKPRILYIGALWGEWFDWSLLQKISERYPDGAVVVIGDYVGQSPFEAENVHFLGLKAQTDLPGYLMHSDVAIIPWEISPITQATSPLKVFEYIAMGVPVVAPKLDPLMEIPYVYLSKDHHAFLENIEEARQCKIEESVLEKFLRMNSWEARIERLAEVVPGI
jgi:glycosyltransferase involved in cell wall biosynthesis